MKISVLIPVYNGERTIRATIESVLGQTRPADEILVLNDGSTDNTPSIISSYAPRVKLISEVNGGVARARNILCRRAKGDILGFIDADDIWHPKYLEVQHDAAERYPSAVAFYAGHLNFHGDKHYQWKNDAPLEGVHAELMPPVDYFVRYNRRTADFGSMSYCCVRREPLLQLGEDIFCVDGVEDSYLSCQLALSGSVVFIPAQLVAYRITERSLSADHLKTYKRWVSMFELMRPRYEMSGNSRLLLAFKRAFASKRRVYAKMLMGAARVAEAREQLHRSLEDASDSLSRAKSAAVLSATYLPQPLQPRWPSGQRSVA